MLLRTVTLGLLVYSGIMNSVMAQNNLDNPAFTDVGALPELGQAIGKAMKSAKDLVAEDAALLVSKSAPGAAKMALSASSNVQELGTPKRDFIIRLDHLRAYKGGTVDALLIDTKQVYYPVYVDKRPVSTVTMVHGKNGWAMTSVGETEITQKRQKAIGKSIKRFAKKDAEHFVVRIPSLSIEFTAFRNLAGEIQFASIIDNERYGLTAGEAEDAKAVLSRIVPHAREFKELK